MKRRSYTDPRGQRDNSGNISGGRYALLVCLIITALAVVAMGLFVPSDGAKNPIEAFMLFARNGFKQGSDSPRRRHGRQRQRFRSGDRAGKRQCDRYGDGRRAFRKRSAGADRYRSDRFSDDRCSGGADKSDRVL